MSIIQSFINSKADATSLSESVTRIKYHELSLLVIQHKSCTATISLQGAQLLFWQPSKQKDPVIWLSEQSEFKHKTPIRGGVPICWPWFAKMGGEPMHGFARLLEWQLISHQANDEEVTLLLNLVSSEQSKQYWPYDFELEMTMHLGKTCQLILACRGDFVATSALHSYFAVSDISSVKVTGLGNTYDERLPLKNRPTVVGEMIFNQEVDRIYNNPEHVSFITDKDRKIKLTHINCSDIVTWNPWLEKSKKLTDMADESYHNMLCVETCRINQPIKSSAQEKTTFGVKIEVL